MADLLLELFSEEIPARMQQSAALNLWMRLEAQLKEAGLPKITPPADGALVTPRRLVLLLKDLPVQLEAKSTELKGPKIDAPEQAIQGFLKKSGLKLDQLEKRDGVYIAIVKSESRPTADILKHAIESVLADFPWPKSMRWGNHDIRWVRPLHSILCIFDGKVVPVEFGGIKAGNVTYGHRFLAPQAITITRADEYEAKLEKAYVIVDRARRMEMIRSKGEAAAKSINLTVKADEGLLEEVTGLVEWPVVLVGSIDANYMDLPPEVLVSEMRGHQKYFALQNADGTLADQFLITANMQTKDGGKAIIAGNERVLRARLADGRFFWDQDRKKKLEDWAHGLKSVTYHEKLGSVADKVERVKTLALALAANVDPGLRRDDVERAAGLCKADLVTGMVGEFPELQGVMGRYYAAAQKESQAVADAIRDHYKPMGPADSVPAAPVSVCVALADKLDTLCGMFAIGEKPTGSKDPFALRRAALGIIRIILENNIRLPLKTCFVAPGKVIALHSAHEKLVQKTEASLQGAHRVGRYLAVNETACADAEAAVPPDFADTLYAFFADRLKVQLKDKGIRHDVIDAVMASGDDDLVRVVARAKALQDFLASEEGGNLLTAYKRATSIVSAEQKKDKAEYLFSDLDTNLLQADEEISLHKVLVDLNEYIVPLLAKEEFEDTMLVFARLRKPIDAFFDKVLVNDKDPSLRMNRLRLLSSLRATFDSIADFGTIEG